MPHTRIIVSAFSLLVLVTVALAAGCSSGTSRESARDQATTATCDRFNMCAAFPSTSYPTREACQLDWRSKWETTWPAASCDGKIDQGAFETCLAAIRSTACNNIFDFFSTVDKCSQANVCHSAADGG